METVVSGLGSVLSAAPVLPVKHSPTIARGAVDQVDAARAEARAEERLRMRRELHDVLGPTMTAATMRAETARFRLSDNPLAADALGGLLVDLRRALDELRGLARECETEGTTTVLLLRSLRQEGDRFEEVSGGRLRVRVTGPGLPSPISATVAEAVRRLLAEALVNVARHSRARTCSVRLDYDSAELGLEIRDDGVGMPEGFTAGVGLSSMCARVERLGGSLRIASRPMAGTRLLARFPLRRNGR